MSKEYGAIEVKLKSTGERAVIKFVRFNPELHEKVGDPFTMYGALDYNKPVNIQTNDLAGAIARGEAQRDEEIRAKLEKDLQNEIGASQEVIETKEELLVESQEEKVENAIEIDLSQLSEEKVAELSWNELKFVAKSLDLRIGGVKDELLRAQVINKLFNNSSNHA